METYYIIKDGKKKGPYSFNKILEMNLLETTLVWRPGIQDWTELRNLEEYKNIMPPPIPEVHPKIEENVSHADEKKDQEKIQSDITLLPSINEKEFKHAGFFLRLSAFIIDFLLMFFLTSFIWAILQIPIPSDSLTLLSGSFYLFKNPLSILFGWLFYASFECSKFQATPGKMILNLRVTDIFNSRIPFGQATGRFFGKILSGLIIGIGYIMIGFTKEKQGLHDKLAKTFVVKNMPRNKKNSSFSWIAFSISFVLFIIALFIPSNTSLIDSTINSKLDLPFNTTKQPVSFSIENLSFNYPADWKITDNSELENGLGRNISFEKTGANSSGVVTITWLNQELELEMGLEVMKNTIKENILYKNAIFSDNQNINIQNNNSLKTTYKFSILNVPHSGELITFILNEKTVFVLIQGADEDYNQNKYGFDLILNSIKPTI